jgi:hypothetical protein
MRKTFAIISALLGSAGGGSAPAEASNILPNAYAWSENGGWINFAPASGTGVTVTDSHVVGFAWSENFGWIDLAPIGAGVANDLGQLSGYAWGENAGWINFAPPIGGVLIDVSGKFTGLAWGENLGWINFTTQQPVTTTWPESDVIFADTFE